jgi:drug/metabolite transporter, DME family
MPPAAIAMVLTATTMYGAMGVVIHVLIDSGLAPLQVVYYSASLSTVLLVAGLLVFAPHYLRVSRGALPELAVVGFLSSGASFILYTLAIDLVGVSLAILLNYTSPVWVTLLAWRFLGERVGRGRLIALLSALAGCVLLVRLYDPAEIRIDLLGVLLALSSGLVWASFQVFGKRVLQRHHPFTLAVYSGATASLVLLPLQSAPLPTELAAGVWPLLAIFVGVSLVGPVLFNTGLRLLEAGVVSMLAISELLVGVLLGVMVAGDRFELPQAIGALLLGASVLGLRSSGAAPPVLEPILSDREVRASRGRGRG